MSDDAYRTDARLNSIAGRVGHVRPSDAEPTIPSSAPTSTKCSPAVTFLVHHVDVTVGAQPVRAIEILGEPDGAGGFLARSSTTKATPS